MVQADVPQGRNGKHRGIVTTILKDLDALKAGSAIKVPLAELAESKEKVRSALNRANPQSRPQSRHRRRCDFPLRLESVGASLKRAQAEGRILLLILTL